MRCQRVAGAAAYMDAGAAGWQTVPVEKVRLVPTPLGLQPTAYVRAAWEKRPYGVVSEVAVAAIHDGTTLVFRLEWQTGSAERGGDFPDGAAVAMPVRGAPPLTTMGAADAPVHILHWSAARDGARSVVADGIGTSREGPAVGADAKGAWNAGGWQVVVSRSLAGPDGAAPVAPGASTRVGFAVWSGANRERAGIKAFSVDWLDLAIDG